MLRFPRPVCAHPTVDMIHSLNWTNVWFLLQPPRFSLVNRKNTDRKRCSKKSPRQSPRPSLSQTTLLKRQVKKIPLVLLHSVLLTHLLPPADTCNVSGPLDTLQVTTRLPTLIFPAPLHLGTGLQLRVQIDKLRHRIAGLEEELASERKASAKTLDDARSQVEGLRTLNQTVRKCI